MKERSYLACAVIEGQSSHRRRPTSVEVAVKHSSSWRSKVGFLWRSVRPGERGQAMVEIAFVLPLFLLFVFAIIEIGRAWGAKQALTIAAREGARILILPYGPDFTYTSEADLQAAALDAVKTSMNTAGIPAALAQITIARIKPGDDGVFNTSDDQVEKNYSGGQRGDRVGIQITYPFETPVPIILKMFENGGVAADAPTQSVINMGVTSYMDHE